MECKRFHNLEIRAKPQQQDRLREVSPETGSQEARGQEEETMIRSIVIAAAIGALSLPCWAADAPTAEVLHFWTSGGEQKAVSVLAEEFKKRGGVWIDTAIVGWDSAQQTAMSRMQGGDPPGAMLWVVGTDVGNLAEKELLNNIDDIAARVNWTSFLPPLVVDAIRYNGHFVAGPVDLHGENWMWYSTKIYNELGLSPPASWSEFFQQADKIKNAGYIPLALGGQGWQEYMLFITVLIDQGGKDLYRKIFNDKDPVAARSDGMIQSLQTFAKLRQYVDQGSPGRNWNDATNLVATNKAAIQIMGDWAKGEFLAAGMAPDKEFGCRMAPGSDAAYIIAIDVFVFPKTQKESAIAGQKLLAEVLLDPDVQVRFNKAKGAVPVRQDLKDADLDACGKLAMNVLAKAENQLPNPQLAFSGKVYGAIEDAVSAFWNNPDADPGTTAEAIATALAGAKK
jgi:glucose/mannose transport system substrate-binding protein